jgi:hypothetical protein
MPHHIFKIMIDVLTCTFMICMCRYIVEHDVEDRVKSGIFMCGMQAAEEGKPCSNIYEWDPLLPCDKPLEAVFYGRGLC